MFDMGSGSHITTSNATHHRHKYNNLDPNASISISVPPNWICHVHMYSCLSVCGMQNDPLLSNEKPLSLMEVTIARIYIQNSLRFYVHSMIELKDMKAKISFPTDKIAAVNENSFRFCIQLHALSISISAWATTNTTATNTGSTHKKIRPPQTPTHTRAHSCM